VEEDLRREIRAAPPVTPISRMLSDSAVFLEHWQSLAGSSPTATAKAADVCQWLQRSLADVVSPGSIARGMDRGKEAAAGAKELPTAESADGPSDEEQRLPALGDDRSSSASASTLTRIELSMTIVTTLHCRRGELIFEHMVAAAAEEAVVPQPPAAASHPTGTLSYREFQLHLPVTDLGFSVDNTLMVIGGDVDGDGGGGGVVAMKIMPKLLLLPPPPPPLLLLLLLLLLISTIQLHQQQQKPHPSNRSTAPFLSSPTAAAAA
jgi:hypothetical protein